VRVRHATFAASFFHARLIASAIVYPEVFSGKRVAIRANFLVAAPVAALACHVRVVVRRRTDKQMVRVHA
jgi:hypothetical protein